MKPWDVVEITWLDSMHDSSGWKYRTKADIEEKDRLTHKSVGYLFHRGKLTTSIVQSIQEKVHEDGARCTDALMEIPTRAILRMRRLR